MEGSLAQLENFERTASARLRYRETTMAEDVYWVLEVTVKPQRLDDLKTPMETMVNSTKSSEPGTLTYEWSVDAADTIVHLYERYEDSSPSLRHLTPFQLKIR